MRATCQKIDGFLVGSEEDHKGRHIVTAYLNAIPVTRFNANDNTERRKAAIELVELELCTKGTAANICGFHRNTVSNLVKTKQLLGLEAAIREERGRSGPVKYIESIQKHVIKLLESYPDWSDQKIANQASLDLNMDVTRNAVTRIRIKNDPPKPKQPSKQELLDMEKTAQDICKEHSVEKQLQLPLQFDPELREKQEELSNTNPPEAKTKTEKGFIEDLQEGKRIPFVGALMHNLFLQEIGIEDLLSCYPYQSGACYQAVDILGTIFHSINLGFPSIESLKLVNSGDLGVLIGQRRAPEKETLRDRLGNLASYEQSPKLIQDLAWQLLEQQRIDREVFFIDGHFLPYFGMHLIAKGYHTVRRMALKGNEIYAITDLNGRPLFFLTESCEVDFRPMISRSAEMLEDLGIERPMLVFDRGGFGINFFKELDSRADFVTWAKYANEGKYKHLSEEDGFDSCLLIEGKQLLITEDRRIATESKITAQKAGRSEATSMELRLVIMRDKKTNRHIGIYTNNWTKPAYEIAFYMCQRWGKSENFFKETLAWFNLDYHPGYDLKELEEQPLVNNPDVDLVKKGIKALKNDIEDLQKDIDLSKYKLGDRKDKRTENKIDRLEQKKKDKESELENFETRLSELPEKISILELLKGKSMNSCDLEKKKLYDLMQCLAFHSRERLVDIFKECYEDTQDIKQVLNMITRKPGLVKLIGDTLVVILDNIENKKHREAVEKFFHKLNEKKISLVGRLKVKLSFHLNKTNPKGLNQKPQSNA